MRKIVYALLLTLVANVAKAQVTSANGTFIAAGTTNLGLLTNTTPRLTIIGSGTNTGRVWIGTGTPAPADLLHVNGTMRGTQLNLTGGILNTIGATNLSFRTNNTQWMTLLSNGKVGIGTPAPAYKLDVAGTINATSILINGQPLPTSQWTTSGSDITYSAGNVGIGTNNPQEKLHVINGAIMTSHPTFFNINAKLNASSGIPTLKFTRWIGVGNTNHNAFVGQIFNSQLGEYSLGLGTGSSATGDQNASTTAMAITLAGNVGIGTTAPGSFKLAVNGKIWAQEVQVALTNPGPDYVFEPSYNLMPLSQIEAYIKEHKHLPEVPSAKEMETNGVQLSEMNMLLLKKLEELTLHVIELEKKLNSLSNDKKK